MSNEVYRRPNSFRRDQMTADDLGKDTLPPPPTSLSVDMSGGEFRASGSVVDQPALQDFLKKRVGLEITREDAAPGDIGRTAPFKPVSVSDEVLQGEHFQDDLLDTTEWNPAQRVAQRSSARAYQELTTATPERDVLFNLGIDSDELVLFKFCPGCGSKFSKKERFCPECGVKRGTYKVPDA